MKFAYWTCPGCMKAGNARQTDSEAYLSVADRCFASWGYSFLMKVQLALNYYRVTAAVITYNWSSFLNCESAPKLQLLYCTHCTSTLVLWLEAVSISPRETWIWLKVWHKVELIPCRIRDVVLSCFLPVLTGWSKLLLHCTALCHHFFAVPCKN